MRTTANRLIDPKILAGTSNLQLLAKTVVEGFVAGLHRSPYYGFSLEFAEYREYSPGDDIRRVDWKVFGRTDRFFVKKFEGDTNTQILILLDSSRSMEFAGSGLSKFDYSRYLAAALAYFGSRQHDSVGLITFDSKIRRFTPPRSRHGHLLTVLDHLETTDSTGTTRLTAVLNNLSRLIRKRSLVIVISDFYEDIEKLARALRFFHHRGNDVILFHVLDPVEIDMPLEGAVTLEDMESGDQIPFIGERGRQAYLRQLEEHLVSLKREAHTVRIDYELLRTDVPLDQALFKYLAVRSRRM